MSRKLVIGINPDVIGTKEPLTNLLTEWRSALLSDVMQRLDMKVLQYLTCLLTCLAAMADLILRLQFKFGHGLI
jgi:hypothetical protein